MGYKVIYIEKSEHLHLYLDNIKIDTDSGEITIPLSDVQTLIIDNDRTNLSVKLINALCQNNICTITCGVDHLPKGYIYAINGHYSQSGNLQKQICWDNETKAALCKEIVKGKIQNQMRIMVKYRCMDAAIDRMKKYIDEVELNDSTNREGLAAKTYFRALFGDNFIRFDNDIINAGLNYGYSILRSLITSIIISKGYLPNLGIFHKGKENMFNLSDDVIEVFRPIVDDYVRSNMVDDLLFKSEHREGLIRLSIGRIEINGSTQTLSNAIEMYFESIIKCIDINCIDNYILPDCVISYDI